MGPETDTCSQFMGTITDPLCRFLGSKYLFLFLLSRFLEKTIRTRNWQNMWVSGPRNWNYIWARDTLCLSLTKINIFHLIICKLCTKCIDNWFNHKTISKLKQVSRNKISLRIWGKCKLVNNGNSLQIIGLSLIECLQQNVQYIWRCRQATLSLMLWELGFKLICLRHESKEHKLKALLNFNQADHYNMKPTQAHANVALILGKVMSSVDYLVKLVYTQMNSRENWYSRVSFSTFR